MTANACTSVRVHTAHSTGTAGAQNPPTAHGGCTAPHIALAQLQLQQQRSIILHMAFIYLHLIKKSRCTIGSGCKMARHHPRGALAFGAVIHLPMATARKPRPRCDTSRPTSRTSAIHQAGYITVHLRRLQPLRMTPLSCWLKIAAGHWCQPLT